MDLDTIIEQLQRTHAGSRRLDGNIALAIGWRLQTDNIVDPVTGQPRQRNMWFKPKSNELAPVPSYTTNLTETYALAKLIAPQARIGTSWENGKGSAKIGDGPYIEAASGPLALCLASLHHKKIDRT